GEVAGGHSPNTEAARRPVLAKIPGQRFVSAAEFVGALKPAAWPSRHVDEAGILPTRRIVRQDRIPVVLVVDDGPANRELIEACLAGVDCEVRTAEDG